MSIRPPSPSGASAALPLLADAWYGPVFAAKTAAGMTLNQLVARAVPIPAGTTIDQLSVNVTTGGASSVIRLGAWDGDDNGLPGAVLVDDATLSGATTGDKTINVDFTTATDVLWLGAVVQTATCSLRVATGSAGVPLPGTLANITGSNSVFEALTVNGVSGALPADFFDTISGYTISAPVVAFHVAA